MWAGCSTRETASIVPRWPCKDSKQLPIPEHLLFKFWLSQPSAVWCWDTDQKTWAPFWPTRSWWSLSNAPGSQQPSDSDCFDSNKWNPKGCVGVWALVPIHLISSHFAISREWTWIFQIFFLREQQSSLMILISSQLLGKTCLSGKNSQNVNVVHYEVWGKNP